MHQCVQSTYLLQLVKVILGGLPNMAPQETVVHHYCICSTVVVVMFTL